MPVFHLIPHSHWDREWYLSAPAFRARLVPMLDDLLARLEAEPALRSFLLDGQTVLAEDYLQVRPDAEPRLRALARDGRLQLGPWYVLADELIPSGESLVRNLLLGRRDAERLGGRLDVYYSPDAFGHPAAGPALAAGFGIRYGVVWRGLAAERDLVRWRGADGGEIVVYHLPPGGYEIGAGLPADRAALPAAWAPVRDALLRRATGPHVAVFVGADHHAVHPDLPCLRELLAALEPDSEVRISRLDEFLAAAAGSVPGDRLPVIAGELRWSYGHTWTLQGVHGTRLPLKRLNGEAELSLERSAEPLAARLRLARTGADQAALLAHAWRLLVRAQFHDSIGGCAADPVARAAGLRMEGAKAVAAEVARAAAHALVGHDPDRVCDTPAADLAPRLVLWNPAARRRGGVVIADTTWFGRDVLVGPPGVRRPRTGSPPGAFGLRDVSGGAIGVQELGRTTALERMDSARHYPDQDEVELVRVAFVAPAVSGLGFAELTPGEAVPLPDRDAVRVGARELENRWLRVRVESDGSLDLIDLRSGRRHRELLRLDHEDDAGDAYTPAVSPSRPIRSAGPVTVRPAAGGPLVGALEIGWSATLSSGRVALRLLVSLRADDPYLRCTVELDNAARDGRLRLRIPTGAAGAEAVAGAPFGAVRRAPVVVDPAEYPAETPLATAPAHRYVAAARDGRGLALFAAGFLEYELTPAGDLLVTLLRSTGELSRADLATRPGHAGWSTATPGAQCPGLHRLQLAVAALDRGGADPASLAEAWEDLFLPVRSIWLRQSLPLDVPGEGLELEGDGLIFSAAKPADEGDGVVLRCYNAGDTRVAGAWRLPVPVAAAARARLDERSPKPIALDRSGRTIRFEADPHEPVTILVTPS